MPRFSEDGYLPNTWYLPGKEQRIKEQIITLEHERRRGTLAQRDIFNGRIGSLKKIIGGIEALYAKGRDTISHAEFAKLEADAAEWCEAYLALMKQHDKAIQQAKTLARSNREIAESHARRQAIEQRILEIAAARPNLAGVQAQIAETKRLIAESQRLRAGSRKQ